MLFCHLQAKLFLETVRTSYFVHSYLILSSPQQSALGLLGMRCVWKYKRKTEERGNEVGWEETHGDRVPFLVWRSSLPSHINAKGPDSVPAKHSAMFSEWIQEQIGPKSFNSVLKYNSFHFFFFSDLGPHVGNKLACCFLPASNVMVHTVNQNPTMWP